jgi:hypothetical protein
MLSASLITSRGCARACRFCAIGERFRVRSARAVIAEISACYHAGVRHFNFEDDNINYNPSLAVIVDALIDRFPKVRISFMNGLLTYKLGLRLRTKLIAAGLTHLDFSLISSKGHLRRSVSRLDAPRRMFSLARSFAAHELDSTVHFIVGLPRERFTDALADLRVLSAQPVRLGQSIFYPVIESPLFEDLEDVFGVKKSDCGLFRSSAAFFDKALSRDELFTVFYYSRVINFIKEIVDAHSLGTRSFAALLARAHRDFISRDPSIVAGSPGRSLLGVVLLAVLFKRGVVCRAQSAPGGYRLQEEDFIDTAITRRFFSGLRVCSCRLRSVRLPLIRPYGA